MRFDGKQVGNVFKCDCILLVSDQNGTFDFTGHRVRYDGEILPDKYLS